MKKLLLPAALGIFVSLSVASAAAADGGLYLVLSHDPAFLETLEGSAGTVYKRGRTMVVKLNVPYDALPPDARAKLRTVSMEEVYNAPSGFRVTVEDRPEIRELISKVSGARLKGYAETLTYTGKRSTAQLDVKSGSGNKLAMDAVAGAFSSSGLSVERHCYKNRKFDRECNIIGRRAGPSPDSKIVIILGHIDSVGYENAGADDNASGAAGVLEMARVLSGYRSDHEFVFVAANGEETGIAGARALADRFSADGTMGRIAWAINMDMIAWNRDGVVELETNREFTLHAEWVSALARTYTSLEPYIATPAWGSDHVPFLEAGVPTYLSIEHWEDHNPCYHKACDKMETLSWTYASEIVKLNLAVVAGKTALVKLK